MRLPDPFALRHTRSSHECIPPLSIPSIRKCSRRAGRSKDFLPLKGTDHVEFYVGNARQAAYFYRAAFGMSLVAYAGPETGQRDRASYVVQQGKVRFVLTTPLRGGNPIADHIHRHGDGVRVIALWVDDARAAWHETTSRGAVSVAEPYVLSTRTAWPCCRAFAPTATRFIRLWSAPGTAGHFCPAFAPLKATRRASGGPVCTSITW